MRKIAEFGAWAVWERPIIDYRIPYEVRWYDKVMEEFHYSVRDQQ